MTIDATFLVQTAPPEPPDLPPSDGTGEVGAWTAQGVLGTIANLVMIAAALWALLAAAASAGAARLKVSARSAGITTALALAATVAVVLRMIFSVEDASLVYGIFVALAGALLIAIGGVLGRREEVASER